MAASRQLPTSNGPGRCVGVLLLLSLPFLLLAVRDTNSAAGGERAGDPEDHPLDDPWATKFGEYRCCCKSKQPKKCEYRLSFMEPDSDDWDDENTDLCCKLKANKCPTFSQYSKLRISHCWTLESDVDLQALPDYQVVNPETAQAFNLERDRAMTPLASSVAKGGRIMYHYLARRRTGKEKNSPEEELVMLTRAPDEHTSAKVKKNCDRIQKVQSSISSGGPAAMANMKHVSRCHHFDTTLSLLVMEYAGEAPIHGLPTPVVPFAKPRALLGLLKQVFLGLESLSLAVPAQVHRSLSWNSVAVDANRCLKLSGLNAAATAGETEGVRPLSSTPYLAPECKSNKACAPTVALDAYSAGMMVFLSLCGAPEYFLLEGFQKDPRAAVREIDREVRAGSSELGASYSFGLRRAAEAMAGLTMKQQVEYLAKKTIPEDFLHRDALRPKIQFCKAAIVEEEHLDPAGTLLIIDKLLSGDPGARPSPTEVLRSSLFADAPTGCDWSRPGDRFTKWGTDPRPTRLETKIVDGVELLIANPQAKAREYVKSLSTGFWTKKQNPAVIDGYLAMMRDVAHWEERDIRCWMYTVMQQFHDLVPDGAKVKFTKFNLNYFHPDKAMSEEVEVQEAANTAFSEMTAFNRDTYVYAGGGDSPCMA